MLMVRERGKRRVVRRVIVAKDHSAAFGHVLKPVFVDNDPARSAHNEQGEIHYGSVDEMHGSPQVQRIVGRAIVPFDMGRKNDGARADGLFDLLDEGAHQRTAARMADCACCHRARSFAKAYQSK